MYDRILYFPKVHYINWRRNLITIRHEIDLCVIFHWRSEFDGFIKESHRKSELEKS